MSLQLFDVPDVDYRYEASREVEFQPALIKNSAAPRFSTHFSVSGYRMKHCVSFLIYYMNNRFYKINARDLII